MKQIEFHSNGRRWLMQSLPDASFVHCEVNGNTLCMGRVPDEGTIVHLPPGDWRILGVAGELGEEITSEIKEDDRITWEEWIRSFQLNPSTTQILVDQSTETQS